LIEIIPSIIAKSYEEFEQLIRKIEPYTQRVQLDIMDGVFVSNTTIDGYEEVARIDIPIKFDVHLMVQGLEDRLESWTDEKADRFILHVESAFEHAEVLDHLRNTDRKAGLALNPDTPIEILEPFLDCVDFIQFMTVYPGNYGAVFIPKVLEKIRKLRALRPDMMIMADGGVRPETVPSLVDAGCNILICGSYLFKSPDPGAALAEIKNLANK
jgi:ribulose-phosphate 3-epimerase